MDFNKNLETPVCMSINNINSILLYYISAGFRAQIDLSKLGFSAGNDQLETGTALFVSWKKWTRKRKLPPQVPKGINVPGWYQCIIILSSCITNFYPSQLSFGFLSRAGLSGYPLWIHRWYRHGMNVFLFISLCVRYMIIYIYIQSGAP